MQQKGLLVLIILSCATGTFVARFEVAQSLADSLVGKRAYPEADERGGASGIMIEVAEDKLTLASGIGRHDDLFAFLE